MDDLRQIRYALSVGKERSFTRASQRLNVSQSAISEQVRGLEERIGFDLFRRHGRGVEPTEKGRLFLSEAERVASDLLGLIDLARRLQGLGADSLRVGLGSGLGALFLPPLFSDAGLPRDVHVEIRTATTRVIFDALQSETLDVGIVVEASPDRAPAGLVLSPLGEIEMVAVATQGLDLPLSQGRLDLAQLRDAPIIMSEMSVGYGAVVAEMLGALGVRPRVRATVDNIETMKMVVRATPSVAFVPAGAARAQDAKGLRVLRLLPDCRLRAAAYAPRQSLSPRKQALVQRLIAACEKRASRRGASSRPA